MKYGDSVYDGTKDGLAHHFDARTGDTARMACGVVIRYARLNHNERRRVPCGNCGRVVEGRLARDIAEAYPQDAEWFAKRFADASPKPGILPLKW